MSTERLRIYGQRNKASALESFTNIPVGPMLSLLGRRVYNLISIPLCEPLCPLCLCGY